MDIREYGFLVLSLIHILVTVAYPLPTSWCPKVENLNPMLFNWSTYTSISIAIIILAGVIRIKAFRTLKENFTFELAAPNRLVTDGIYSLVQHPSYLPDGILTVLNVALFCNPDGFAGCYLPPIWVEQLVPLRPAVLTAIAIIHAIGMSRRIYEEEAMLKAEFGQEWIDYHARTARLIPYVF
jgi:protein-S-isoprenylcysteine O-methyltransferase Ste14